jgi:hypothetical protein
MRDLLSRFGILGELFTFLWKRKLYWLIPMIVVLSIFILLIILSSNPATAPFIYPLF